MALRRLAIENSTFGDVAGHVLSHNIIKYRYQVAGAHPELRPFLSPLDPESQHRTIRDKLTKRTGQWLLNSENFRGWKTAQGPQVLCLTGEPGKGKTSLFCHVVENLRSDPNNPGNVVLFTYCDYLNAEQHTACNLIGAFLWQLTTHLTIHADVVKKLHERQKHNHSLTIDESAELLCKCATSTDFSTIWLCCDALDELYPGERDRLLHELTKICQNSTFRLFLTGRSNAGVEESIKRNILTVFPFITVVHTSVSRKGITSDIRRFLKEKLKQDTTPTLMSEELQKAIFDRLAGTESTFLLAALNIESILQKRTVRGRKEMLYELVLRLENYYWDTMKRIRDGDEEFGIKILHWMLFAVRPLTVTELRYAVAIRPGDHDLRPTEDLPPLSLIDSTLGLVTVDSSQTARFVHSTFKEYLLNNSSLYFPAGHALLAETAIAYLTFDPIAMEAGRRRYDWQGDLYPFRHYATESWGHHVRRCEESGPVESACRLLASDMFPLISDLYEETVPYLPSNLSFSHNSSICASPLHAASYFGLTSVLERLMAESPRIETQLNLKDRSGNTPLSYAAERGYLDIVKVLIKMSNIDLNKRARHGGTALFFAAAGGHTGTVDELLRQKGIDVNSADQYSETPLYCASARGHAHVVQLLLERSDTKVNETDQHGDTPLHSAVTRGHIEVVKLLLQRSDLDVNLTDQDGDSPLSSAMRKGRVDIVETLYSRKDLNTTLPDPVPSKGVRFLSKPAATIGPASSTVYDTARTIEKDYSSQSEAITLKYIRFVFDPDHADKRSRVTTSARGNSTTTYYSCYSSSSREHSTPVSAYTWSSMSTNHHGYQFALESHLRTQRGCTLGNL